MIDVRFSTALQLMLSLVLARREKVGPVSSTQLADGIGSHPTLVRRLVAPLVEAGLIDSSKGRSGGLSLGRRAEEITLLDIYAAISGDKGILAPRANIPHQCLVSSNFEIYFNDLTQEIDTAVREALQQRTLADGFTKLVKLDQKRKKSS